MKSSQNKPVTVCIPTFNRSHLLLKAIESCLAQDYINIEIVVSDNASSDDTESIVLEVKDPRVKYFRFEEPVQPYLNWNNCIQNASGFYVTMLSDDDFLDKNFISSLVNEFERHPDASLVRGVVRCIDIDGQPLWEYKDYPYRETPEEFFIQRIKNRRRQFLPGFMFKAEVIQNVGLFEDNEMPAMLHLDDYFWFKVAFTGTKIITTTQAYWNYRSHGEQYGGKLLNIGDFSRGAIRYIQKLSELTSKLDFSEDTLCFLKNSYLDSMIAHRVYHEERRLSNLVKSAGSLTRTKNAPLNPDSLLVIGCGPSLKGISFDQFTDCQTISINYSYRSWLNGSWCPDYYLSNDAFHCLNDLDGLNELLNGRCKNIIKKYFLRKNVLAHLPELSKRKDIEFIEDAPFYQLKSVMARIDSGGVAVLCGAHLGFSDIYTIGIDLLYSSRHYDPIRWNEMFLKVDRFSKKIKNHFLENYYADGYLISRPRLTKNLISGWRALVQELDRQNIKVTSTTKNSLLNGILPYKTYFGEPGYDVHHCDDNVSSPLNPQNSSYESIRTMIQKQKPTIPGFEYPAYMRLEENREIPVDIDALRLFKDIHKGQRCFIVGNGPSLNKTDLSKLKNEITFGVNSIFLMTDINGFTPTYYSVCDSHVIAENTDRILSIPAKHKFFPSVFRKYIPPSSRSNVSFFMMNRGYNEISSPNYSVPRFSTDCSERIFDGQTITYINLQLAYYMGFSEVYLIGVDFSYVIPDSAIRDGANILSTADDPNHFHKDYFGKGRSWHDPVLHRVVKNYEFSDMVYKWDSRRVFNATVGGQLEVFERVDYYSLFD